MIEPFKEVGQAIDAKLGSTKGSRQEGLYRIFRGDHYARFKLAPEEYKRWKRELFLPQSMEEYGSDGDDPLVVTLSQKGQKRILDVSLNRKLLGGPSFCKLELPAGRVRVDNGVLPYDYHWLGSCSAEEQTRLVEATINVINDLNPL